MAAPPPHGLVRIGLGGGGAPLLPSPLFLLPFLLLVGIGEGGRERGEEGKGGAAPLLVQFRLEGEGLAAALGRPSSSPLGPNRPISLPGGFR